MTNAILHPFPKLSAVIVIVWTVSAAVAHDFMPAEQFASENSEKHSQTRNDIDQFRELRDAGIRMLGWVAGNSSTHPIWPKMKPYVGRRGEYYDLLVGLVPPGLARDLRKEEAFRNVILYQEWFRKGQASPFDGKDNADKARRILQTIEELSLFLRDSGKWVGKEDTAIRGQ